MLFLQMQAFQSEHLKGTNHNFAQNVATTFHLK